jgi:hypothetical protein
MNLNPFPFLQGNSLNDIQFHVSMSWWFRAKNGLGIFLREAYTGSESTSISIHLFWRNAIDIFLWFVIKDSCFNRSKNVCLVLLLWKLEKDFVLITLSSLCCIDLMSSFLWFSFEWSATWIPNKTSDVRVCSTLRLGLFPLFFSLRKWFVEHRMGCHVFIIYSHLCWSSSRRWTTSTTLSSPCLFVVSVLFIGNPFAWQEIYLLLSWSNHCEDTESLSYFKRDCQSRWKWCLSLEVRESLLPLIYNA